VNFGTSYGLAFSSGINAYLPLLSFSIAVRWFHLYHVNPQYAFITQDWFIAGLVLLTIADLVADKIPYFDHIWDIIHTVLRPIAGALVAAASESQVTGAGQVVPLVVGAGLAAMTHTTKAATRVASTASSAGLLNTILSIAEDVVVVLAVLFSLLLPVVMVVVLVVFVVIFLVTVPRIIRRLRRRKSPGANQNANVPLSR
jgi:hypothetical protein